MSESSIKSPAEIGKENRQIWLDSPYVDDATKQGVRDVTDEGEIAEAFSRDLAFGTGGMRGVMGPGNNRMNPYTVRRAIIGVAKWLEKAGPEALAKGAAIACDTRNNSVDYAKHAAVTLADRGVTVYLFDTPAPTPVLSFAVKRFGCATGVVITASHNTKEFNGMKIYNDGGCQLPPDEVDPLMEEIDATPLFSPLPESDFEALKAAGKIKLLGAEVRDEFVEVVKGYSLLADAEAKKALSIVYTPLNGAGNLYVRQTLAGVGFDRVTVVPEQEHPDGDFPTVKQPNPEITAALALSIELGLRTKADLVVGTDPDSDRLGAAVYHDGDFHNITGNQIGVLLTDFILMSRKQRGELPGPGKGVFINTIVSSSLGEVIGRAYGLKIIKVLTGFKFIGEQMIRMKNASFKGGEEEYVFGYEESNGYLPGDYARDKDAVGAALLFCETAAYWKKRGKTLIERLDDIYAEYGYFLDHLDEYVFPGIEGMVIMAGLMEKFREKGVAAIPQIRELEDYELGVGDLPKDNVLRFMLEGDSWIAVRPSGTEPKLKVYYSISGRDKDKAVERLELLRKAVDSIIK